MFIGVAAPVSAVSQLHEPSSEMESIITDLFAALRKDSSIFEREGVPMDNVFNFDVNNSNNISLESTLDLLSLSEDVESVAISSGPGGDMEIAIRDLFTALHKENK